MRRNVTSFLGLTLLALLLALFFWNPPSISRSPAVLIVGEFDAYNGEETPAERLYRSLERARNGRNPPYAAEIIKISVPDYWDSRRQGASPSDLRNTLLSEIAQNDVVAIISANTTQTAGPVIDLASKFNIPVLLTVATNDRLLSDRPTAPVIRVVPRDSLQAIQIATWCQSQVSGDIHVIYDDTQYGRDLFRNLSQHVTRPILGTALKAPCESVAEILSTTKSTAFGAIVFIGYPDQAAEFLQWRTKFMITTPTLLSDGCLGAWVDDPRILTQNVKLCFPNLIPNPEQINVLATSQTSRYNTHGYGPFAVQAMDDLDACIKGCIAHNLSKQRLFDQLLGMRSSSPLENPRAPADRRENTLSEFSIHDVQEMALHE